VNSTDKTATDLVIAIDCMGGDFGPSVVLPAVLKSLDTHSQVSFLVYGDLRLIEPKIRSLPASKQQRIRLFSSKDDVLMSDSPVEAMRNKKESSMRMALEAVRDGQAHACVSAGNTGALMAISKFVLKMLPGIDRPAIISALPTLKNHHVYFLDLGANVECDEHRLAQFAIMGDELAKCLDNIGSPKVGLLNVGEEENKGIERLHKASQLITDLDSVNYVGFVEGSDIFSGDYQVIVTDGFTGNNVLKASEGLSNYLSQKIKHAFERNWWTRFLALLAKPVLNAFKKEINPEKYNGACLIGLRGIVIKSHGGANISATCCAIDEAIRQSYQKVPSRIKAKLENIQIQNQLNQ
jgi:glycerol-3-phosphate acyltransferase PlsX